MSLEKATIVWTAKQIKGMVKNNKIDFNHIVQRKKTWERARKSALIESMILGYPVPTVYSKRVAGDPNKRGDNVYQVMDGKQRFTTVADFQDDGFALTNLPEVEYYDEETDSTCKVNISGMKFSELPEALQHHLQAVTFNITYFDNLTPEEEKELFKRLNNGKALTAKNRLIASCRDINLLLEIGNHDLFFEMLSDSAREDKNQVAIIMKCWVMLNKEISEISFETKKFYPVVESTEINEKDRIQLENIFDFVCNVHASLYDNENKKIAKTIYTETHFVSLIPYFETMVKNNVDVNMACNWLTEFYKNVSEDYDNCCQGGISKSTNIMGRNKVLSESFNKFFNKD